jgi:hypothetical protein
VLAAVRVGLLGLFALIGVTDRHHVLCFGSADLIPPLLSLAVAP